MPPPPDDEQPLPQEDALATSLVFALVYIFGAYGVYNLSTHVAFTLLHNKRSGQVRFGGGAILILILLSYVLPVAFAGGVEEKMEVEKSAAAAAVTVAASVASAAGTLAAAAASGLSSRKRKADPQARGTAPELCALLPLLEPADLVCSPVDGHRRISRSS